MKEMELAHQEAMKTLKIVNIGKLGICKSSHYDLTLYCRNMTKN